MSQNFFFFFFFLRREINLLIQTNNIFDRNIETTLLKNLENYATFRLIA